MRGSKMKKNHHTNIMLDLECTGLLTNPCILQISAVHFDLDTGEEYSHFCTPVSLKSCEDVDLQSTEDTLQWLLQHSPQVLEASKTSEISITQALFRFNVFVRKAIRETRNRLEEAGRTYDSNMSETMIWGNGAVADNMWINSAYEACGMGDRKPWSFKNDMCVRTLVRKANDIFGRNFAREERFQGTRHDALDDCRHQIRYMVKARNSMIRLSAMPKPTPDPNSGITTNSTSHGKEEIEPIEEKLAEMSIDATKTRGSRFPDIIIDTKHPPLSAVEEEPNVQATQTSDAIAFGNIESQSSDAKGILKLDAEAAVLGPPIGTQLIWAVWKKLWL